MRTCCLKDFWVQWFVLDLLITNNLCVLMWQNRLHWQSAHNENLIDGFEILHLESRGERLKQLCWDHCTEAVQHCVLQIGLQSQIMAPASQSSTAAVKLFHTRDSRVWRLLCNVYINLPLFLSVLQPVVKSDCRSDELCCVTAALQRAWSEVFISPRGH